MKKIPILFLLLCLVAGYAYSQNSLGFNQVLLIDNTEQTVPPGKVWKVEGVAGSRVTQYNYASNNNSNFSPAQNQILINGQAISAIHAVGTGAGTGTGSGTVYSGFSYAASPTSFPLWLPAGTTLAASTNVTYISVIEFNVIN
jgi:hypothetical protein